MSEKEILSDFSAYELNFDKSTGLKIIEDSIKELNDVQSPVKLIESDKYWEKAINLVMIVLDLKETDEMYNFILGKNCNVPFIDLFIWLLNEHKSFGKKYLTNLHNYLKIFLISY